MRTCALPHGIRVLKGFIRHMYCRISARCAALFLLLSLSATAAPATGAGYVLILSDPPLAHRMAARESLASIGAARARMEAAHQQVRSELLARGMTPVVTLHTLLNAEIIR